MSRLVEEPIEVRVAEPAGSEESGRQSAAPQHFVWRQRLYRVTEVIDRWAERRDWWRESTSGAPLGLAATTREVWRVEAQVGRGGARGVYDLVHGAHPEGREAGSEPRSAGPWHVLRTQD